MKRTLQALTAFWPAVMLLSLIFSTMIEGTRTGIEHTEIGGYLLRWVAVVYLPTILFYFLAERGPAEPAH